LLGENEREAGLSPAEHHFGGSDTGLLTPANRVADLSFGTMNLRTIVKNTAFVEDQSQREWEGGGVTPREEIFPGG